MILDASFSNHQHDEASIRTGISPDIAGILQANAYAGFGEGHREARKPIALTEALCWAHGRRNFFKRAQVAKYPSADDRLRAWGLSRL